MILSNFNLSQADHNIARAVTDMVLDDGVVVFRNQNLSPDEEVAFCKMIGECQRLQNKAAEGGEHIAVNDHIIRVTGEKNNHGDWIVWTHFCTGLACQSSKQL